MLKKIILSVTLMTAGSTSLFAMHRDDTVGPYDLNRDTIGSKERTVTKTSDFTIEDIKGLIVDSSWCKKYSNLDNQILVQTLPETALESDSQMVNKKLVRVDSEGCHTDTGAKFRFQSGETTYASVRVAPGVTWLYPSQLAKALYLSTKTGERKVIH